LSINGENHDLKIVCMVACLLTGMSNISDAGVEALVEAGCGCGLRTLILGAVWQCPFGSYCGVLDCGLAQWPLQWELCVLEGLWVSFVRVGDSFCSLDRHVHLVFLNAGCCECVGDPGPALCCCCCCLQVCVFVCVFLVACVCPCLWYFLTLFPLLSTCFCFVGVCDVV